MTEEKIVKCSCGIEFDLVKAAWCNHSSSRTKLCPNGHCVCYLLKYEKRWRPATEEEQKFGFDFMLKEEFGGVKK